MTRHTGLLTLFFLGLASGLSAGTGNIHLTVGESRLVTVENAQKVAVGNNSVADVTAVSDSEILVSAKAPGSTNLIFLSPDGGKEIRNVVVSTHNLKKSMVEIEAEIVEINSQSALKAGLSWGSIAQGPATEASATTPNNLSISENSPPPLLAFGSLVRQSLTASLQLLIDRGKAKDLSKPKLLSVSGEEASFLAGGEVPYISQSSLGSPNVQWKPYGVKLTIKPNIDGEGNIQSSLRAEVSGIDSQNGISLANTVVPALRTRWVETTVYMKSGSTLVIAGLIEDESQKLTSGIPVLSDIPILGELFRFTDNRQSETELVIFVTPTLVGRAEEEI